MGNFLFKQTNKQLGYHRVISPENTELTLLSYSRLILNKDLPQITLDTNGEEWSLICAGGNGSVNIEGKNYLLGKHDSIYIPRNKKFHVTTQSFIDIIIASAPVERDSIVQTVYFKDLKGVSHGLAETSSHRIIWTPIGSNVDASRLLCGFTLGDNGHWTSWPPHEHTKSREEIYVFEIPAPGFGIQFVFNDIRNMEHMEVVMDGDAVVIPWGYHPNVAAPGSRMKFYWLMAGITPEKDREWADVKVHPDYTGIEI